MGRPRHRLHRPVHGGAGRLHRECRPPVDPARPALQHLEPPVDRQRLHPDLRRVPASRRSSSRPLRAAEDLHGGLGGLHRVEPARRHGAERGLADRRPGPAGPGSGHSGARHPDHPDVDVPRGSRPRQGPGGVECRVRGRRVGRRALRGHLDRLLELALDPVRQRAGRSRRARRGPPSPPRVPRGDGTPPPRSRRGGDGDRWTGGAGLRPRSHRDLLVGVASSPGAARGRGGAHRRLPLLAGPRLEGSARPAQHLPVALGVGRQRRDADDVRGAVRFLVLRDALHAARLGVQPAPGGARLPAADPAHRRRGTGDGAPGAEGRPPPARRPRRAGGGGRTGLAVPDLDRQHVRDRPPRSLHPHRSRHGPCGDPDRGCRHGGRAAGAGGSRFRLAQHVTHGRRIHRPRRVGHRGGQPHLGQADRRGGDAGAHRGGPDRRLRPRLLGGGGRARRHRRGRHGHAPVATPAR